MSKDLLSKLHLRRALCIASCRSKKKNTVFWVHTVPCWIVYLYVTVNLPGADIKRHNKYFTPSGEYCTQRKGERERDIERERDQGKFLFYKNLLQHFYWALNIWEVGEDLPGSPFLFFFSEIKLCKFSEIRFVQNTFALTLLVWFFMNKTDSELLRENLKTNY